ncbi:MlaC/ttg2D family ABC transporter substrate-binding protein [Acetobacter indonesiensis]|uniref:MlaC/ttg2D family ABC transporter substrate-binding protein n=1 Tax=Acetobacter indonesiensis TaxID=104101 RepID=UPI000A35FF41|nr:ABC transporter substrate-binding protein [Acetobacter indonesiensis]MCG0995240.1 ABC transporter substrate-binding protein [Acetobacter indonesiensis]MCP1231341.1 ABC transporter substrate-binding protein [Acetobacter indonesiensis]OUI95002.1 toluene transporter [Acetobacter indonesiensis]
MKFFSGRRLVLGSLALLCAGGLSIMPAHAAQNTKQFIEGFGKQLVAIVNSPVSLPEKKEKVMPLIQKNVDIDAIGRYCLGRYWKLATPAQQKEYLELFHQVLVNAITDKLGDYRGVSFTIGSVTKSGEDEAVEATLLRPQQPPATMQWIVNSATGSEKVVDVIGEGASLRLTQRQDYSSYIARNGGSVDALISALKRQIAHHTAAATQN